MGSKNIPGTVRWDARAAENPTIIQILPGFNARQDLGDLQALRTSIERDGLKDALWVRPDRGNPTQPFILIDGERRLTVLNQLYQESLAKGEPWDRKLPMQVFYVDAQGAEDLMALALLERENPSFCDEANLVSRWIARPLSIQEVATRLNRSTAWVEQRRTFSLLDPQVKQAVRDGKLSVQAALDLARKIPQAQQVEVLQTVLEKSGSRAQTRRAVASCTGTPVRPGKRELVKMVAQVDQRQVNGNSMTVKEAKRLVLAALRYCSGEIQQECFLENYYRTVDHVPDPPAQVVNTLELT